MENVSKALLISAAVLIVILIVTVGIKILNSTGGSKEQAQQVGNSISTASKEALDKINIAGVKSEKENTYEITVNEGYGAKWINQKANTIKEGEEVILEFEQYSGNTWFYIVNGAEYTTFFSANNLKITLKNPSSNITVNVRSDACCFVAGTKVLMGDGTKKNIEKITEGDIVLSYNQMTKEYENNVVTGIITNINTTNLARVTLIDGTSIEMNEYHPIYTVEGWKSITNFKGYPTLTENDKILSINGKYIEILSIERWIEEIPITTYNLSIANNHNYFVGKAPILVHNAGCK